jgi:hypothetical protein
MELWSLQMEGNNGEGDRTKLRGTFRDWEGYLGERRRGGPV